MTNGKMKQVATEKQAHDIEEQVSSGHADHDEDHDQGYALSWREINRILFVAAVAGAIWFLEGSRNPSITAIE
jgi:hypothetical protein